METYYHRDQIIVKNGQKKFTSFKLNNCCLRHIQRTYASNPKNEFLHNCCNLIIDCRDNIVTIKRNKKTKTFIDNGSFLQIMKYLGTINQDVIFQIGVCQEDFIEFIATILVFLICVMVSQFS